MAYEIPGFAYSLVNEGAVVQFTAVVVNSNGKVETAGEDANPIAGVAQMPAAADNEEPIRIMKTGITFAVGQTGDIDPGDTVAVGDDGKFKDATDHVVGVALTDCDDDGELFALLLLTTSDTGV